MATILVVDDEPMMLRLCTNILMRGQHDVMQAADGGAALELSGASRPIWRCWM